MTASVQCMRCGWRFDTVDGYIGHLDGRCVCADDPEVSDAEIEAFMTRHAHPSFGGDAA